MRNIDRAFTHRTKPDRLRKMAPEIGTRTTEIKASHGVFLSQPKAIAAAINAAAKGAVTP